MINRSYPRLFAYGSLGSNAAPSGARAAALLGKGAMREAAASISGRLCACSWFFGVLSGPSGRMAGEVWRSCDPKTLRKVDVYEGRAYLRERCCARLEEGREATSWVYRYIAGLEGVPVIASGDYVCRMDASGINT